MHNTYIYVALKIWKFTPMDYSCFQFYRKAFNLLDLQNVEHSTNQFSDCHWDTNPWLPLCIGIGTESIYPQSNFRKTLNVGTNNNHLFLYRTAALDVWNLTADDVNFEKRRYNIWINKILNSICTYNGSLILLIDFLHVPLHSTSASNLWWS